MKQTKKNLMIGILAALTGCLQSCEKDQLPTAADPTVTTDNQEVTNRLQIAFAKTLSKALQADPLLRKFLKVESNKMFDKDYDILYQMVKDYPIGNGETFRERLAHYAASSNELISIEQQLPLLTIFIPTLPGGFSAETWQTDTEVPLVAVRKLGDKKIPFYGADGREAIMQPSDTPGFPVVVIKQNERVLAATGSTRTENEKTPFFYQNQQFSFNFTGGAFDGIHSNPKTAARIAPQVNKLSVAAGNGGTAGRVAHAPGFEAEERVISAPNITAFELTQANPSAIWQRDYVYYGLTPTNNRGPLKTNFRETIRAFRLSTAGINKIADHPTNPADYDPLNPVVGSTNGNTSAWTDGYFEFTINVLYNAKVGQNSTSVDFGARPDDLYDITYEHIQGGFWLWKYDYYKITSVTPKIMYPSVDIATWDLQNFGTAWVYKIYETNTTTSVTQTYRLQTTYAENFEINAGGTIGVVKVDGKYGASATTVRENTISYAYKLESTNLGEKVAYFYNPVIVSISQGQYGDDLYNTYDLEPGGSAGYVFLSVEPWSIVQRDNYTP